MERRSLKRSGTWLLAAILTGGLAYSILALTAQPAKASSACTATDCDNVAAEADIFCKERGGVRFFYCPIPDNPDEWAYVCAGGGGVNGSCPFE